MIFLLKATIFIQKTRLPDDYRFTLSTLLLYVAFDNKMSPYARFAIVFWKTGCVQGRPVLILYGTQRAVIWGRVYVNPRAGLLPAQQ